MSRMLQRIFLLLAVGTSFTASGQGAIIYTDADIQIFGGRDGYVYHDLDLNADGVTDFQFRATRGELMVIPAGQNAVFGRPVPPPYPVRGEVSSLNFGHTISLNPVPPDSWFPYQWIQAGDGDAIYAGRYGPVFGGWGEVNGDAYMAAQFYIGSEIHYGWIHLRVYNSGFFDYGDFSGGGYIQEWAYDTVPGQGILAGAVPEPSMWALVAIGAFALWGRRRWHPA